LNAITRTFTAVHTWTTWPTSAFGGTTGATTVPATRRSARATIPPHAIFARFTSLVWPTERHTPPRPWTSIETTRSP